MSSDSKEVNIKHEVFRTPRWVYQPILFNYLANKFSGRVLEPCAGDGRIIYDLVNHGNKQKHSLVDIRLSERRIWRYSGLMRQIHHSNCHTMDFLQTSVFDRFDAVITNPPFSLAVNIVEHALDFVKDGDPVLVIQRSNWIGSRQRSIWLDNSCLRRVWVIPIRPVWELDNATNRADSVEYFWFEFVKGRKTSKDPTIRWMWP